MRRGAGVRWRSPRGCGRRLQPDRSCPGVQKEGQRGYRGTQGEGSQTLQQRTEHTSRKYLDTCSIQSDVHSRKLKGCGRAYNATSSPKRGMEGMWKGLQCHIVSEEGYGRDVKGLTMPHRLRRGVWKGCERAYSATSSPKRGMEVEDRKRMSTRLMASEDARRSCRCVSLTS